MDEDVSVKIAGGEQPSRNKNKCKGPEVGRSLECLADIQKARLAAAAERAVE